MRHFLIATAALSLIGGAAFAQTGTGSTTGAPINGADGTPAMQPDGSSPPSSMNNGTTSGGSMNSGSMSNAPGSSMSPGASGSTSGETPNAADGAAAGNSTMASDAPAGTAPSTYPVCTSKHEDRCVNRSQSTHMASMRTHHKMMKTTAAPADAAPAGL